MPFKDPEKRKAKQKLYSRKWYEGNRQHVIKKAKTNKDRTRAAWRIPLPLPFNCPYSEATKKPFSI